MGLKGSQKYVMTANVVHAEHSLAVMAMIARVDWTLALLPCITNAQIAQGHIAIEKPK